MKTPLLAGFLCLSASLALGQKQALFLTSGTPPTGDVAVSNRLASLGFIVTRVTDTVSQTSDANGKDLIVVSSSVGSGNISTKFTASAVPLINGESAIYDELGIEANNVNGATVAGQTSIILVDCTHPLAAGLSPGVITVLSPSGPLVTLGAVVPSAQIVANLNDGTGRPTIFGIESGAALNPARIATAPARRVGLFWEATTFMTVDGLKLFDAAVAWAIATPVPLNAQIGITGQPASVKASLGATAAFTVGFTGAAPYSVQWQRSDGIGGFTNIPGATCPTYRTAPTAATDHGAMFRAAVSNSFSGEISSAATLTLKQCLFLTSATPSAADVFVSNRLASLGFVVTRVNDTLSQTSDANGKDLIFVSSTVGSGNISTKFTTSPVPIVNGESAIYDELGMDSANAGGGTLAGQTQISIVDCTHPLAAGLALGPVTVLTASGPLVYLPTPVASAKIIATLSDGTGRPSVLAIEQGDPMHPARVAAAPARRVGIYLEGTTFMTPDGLKLFDAAVAWAIGQPDSPSAPIGITAQPASLTVNEGEVARFTVGSTGAPPYSIQWLRSDGLGGFTNIPGAMCPTFLTGPTVPDDSNAMFQVTVSNNFSGVLSATATLTVIFDHTPPTLVSAFGGGAPPMSFDLVYSEPVNQSEAEDTFSYTLSTGGTVISAALDADLRTLHCTCDPITNGTILTVVGIVHDRSASMNLLAPNSQIAIITTDGSIRRHQFNDIGGGVLVSDLTNNLKFPNFPDLIDFPTLFETTVGAADNYGVQFLGYVTPPVSGNYHFYMSSDDGGALFLSTDNSPTTKQLIAFEAQWANSREWTGNAGNPAGRNAAAPQNQSRTLFPAGISLVKGQRYYIEALMKEGGGGDNLAVAWQRPGDPIPINGSSPIPGLYLSRYDLPATVPAGQPSDVTILEARQATFSAAPSGSPPLSLQWYESGVLIPSATGPSYTTPLLTTNDSGKNYYLVVSNPLGSSTSRVATLTVLMDTNGPLLVAAAGVHGMDIGLCFDEALDPVTAANSLNYTVNGGAVSVTSATLRYDARTVQLVLGAPVAGTFTVAVANVLDATGRNIIAPGTATNGTVASLTPSDVSTPGDPAAPGSTFSCREDEFEIIAGGSDIWGNADHGHLAYQTFSDNFDKRVLVALIDNSDVSAKGGLMVRESIAADSRDLHAVVMPPPPARNIYETGTRSATAGATAGWGILGGVNGNLTALHPNSWLRLRRAGNTFSAYVSSNGMDWVKNGESIQSYPATVLMGLTATAHNNDGRTNRVLFQNYGNTIYPGSSVTIAQQPANVSIEENHVATFSVGASVSAAPASELAFQWQRDNGAGSFTNIVGASGGTFNPLVLLADNGAQFRAIAYVPGARATSAVATLTVTNDITAPRLVSATRSCATLTQVTVAYNEFVEATSAQDTFNYKLHAANGDEIPISGIVIQPDGQSVVLTASGPLVSGTYYILTVSGVTDLKGNAIAANSQLLITLTGGRQVVGGQVVIEAENYDANTPATDGHFFTFMNVPAGTGPFSGAGYMQSFPETGAAINQPGHSDPGASPRLDYCINFPSAGTWRAWLRGNDIGGGNSVHIGLDGVSTANENFRIGNTGGASGWGNPAGATSPWQWSRDANDSTTTFAAVVVPSPGIHVFNIWMREDRTCVDKILLTTSTTFVISPNTILGPAESAREIEVPAPSLANPRLAGGSFKFEVPAFNGLQYRVECTPGFEPPVTWLPVLTFTGDGTLTTVMIPVTSNDNRFYRVRASAP